MRRLTPLLIITAAGLAVAADAPRNDVGQEVHPSDARRIVAQSITNYEKDYHAALKYNYMQRDVEKTPEGQKVTVSQVTAVAGMPFEKVLTRNGQPLPPSEQRREEDKYKKFLAERATPDAQQKKIAEYENARRFLREVPEAFDFELLPEETINGRANYVVKCTPKPGYVARDSKARMFSKINATLWVDKQDVRWTKARANVIDSVSIGWIMARINQGAKIGIEQTRIADNLWLPSEIDVNGMVKILLVKNHPVGEQVYFSEYRLAGDGAREQTAQLERETR